MKEIYDILLDACYGWQYGDCEKLDEIEIETDETLAELEQTFDEVRKRLYGRWLDKMAEWDEEIMYQQFCKGFFCAMEVGRFLSRPVRRGENEAG